VQTEYTYEPFGKTTSTGAANSSSYQYTGRENDGTGLYYYRARYYHPGLHGFVSEDPIRLTGGTSNFYLYVDNNPTNRTDPSGLILKEVAKRLLKELARRVGKKGGGWLEELIDQWERETENKREGMSDEEEQYRQREWYDDHDRQNNPLPPLPPAEPLPPQENSPKSSETPPLDEY
jgi:RHS repeat-associated protein